jgi:hypothetical protein
VDTAPDVVETDAEKDRALSVVDVLAAASGVLLRVQQPGSSPGRLSG